MNKYQEAYLYIKNYCELDDECIRWPLYHKSIKSLEELVNKATPKKPAHEPDNWDICPKCKNKIFFGRNYCPHCGQALDWSDNKYETD